MGVTGAEIKMLISALLTKRGMSNEMVFDHNSFRRQEIDLEPVKNGYSSNMKLPE